MSYQSGPFGPGYTVPGGPGSPAGTGGPWGPPPGGTGGFGGGSAFGPPGYPPPPPPRKSNTGLILGIVVALVLVVPMCAGIAIWAAGSYAARATRDVGTSPDLPPAPPPPAAPDPPPATGGNEPLQPPVGHRLVRRPGFSYAVPSGWQELSPAELNSPLIEAAQRNTIPAGNFMTNVNVAGEPYAGDGPSYGAANLVQLRTVATIRDQRLVTSGTRPAWDIEALWPNSGGVPYVTLQRYVTNGAKGYVLTCSAGSAAFATQRATCEAILASFRVD